MLFEFRTITRGRKRRAAWFSLLLFAGAFTLYALTAVQYAFPGDSANWIAWCAGLDVREVPARPILTLAGGLLAKLPFGDLATRMNLFSAFLGALTVGLIYQIVWFAIFEFMREESAVAHASRNARLGGLLAAWAVAVSLPFWQAATRFSPDILDAALVVASLHLLTVYARSQRTGWLLLFGLLAGLGSAESPAFLASVPVLAAFCVVAEWKLEWCRINRLFGIGTAAFLTFATTHYLSARFFLLSHGQPANNITILRTVISVLREQFNTISALLPETSWIPVVALGIGCSALVFFSSLRSLSNSRTWSLLALNLVFTLSAGLMLFNAGITPWGILAPKGVIPALTYAWAGMGLGLLTASWRAYSILDDPREQQDVPDDADDEPADDDQKPLVFATTRTAGFMLWPVLAVGIALSGVFNGRRLVADRGEFADRAADTILSDLKGRSWIVSNGLLDPNLLIRAHERGRTIHLLCPYRAREKYYANRILQTFVDDPSFSENAKLRAKSMATFNFHMFIDDLFASDATIGDKAVCMGLPDLWYGSKWVPVPESLFYGGVKNAAALDAQRLLRAHARFWNEWGSFFAESEGSPRQLSYRYRLALRRHCAFLANNLGVALDDADHPKDAFDVYLQVRAISPENISALLNLFELVSRGFHPEMKDAINIDLRHKVENPKERYALWSLSRYYGYVRNYDLFVRMGWAWALSSSPGSILAGLRSSYSIQQDDDKRAALSAMMASLYEMRGDVELSAAEYKKAIDRNPQNMFAISGLVRLALQQNVVDDAKGILKKSELAGVSKRLLRQDWAAVYLVSGDLARARVILQELGDEADASPMTLAMLAMLMIEQNEVASVETTVLPRLIRCKEGKDSYFVHVVKGRVWQNKGVAGYQNARLCYQRAAAIRPDVAALQEVILSMDVALKDQKASEAHALAILRRTPGNPFANYLIGSIRLEQGEYGDAETYLRRSAEVQKPTAAALNNLAQVLCRIRRLDEAENVARKATACAPDRYETWSTLAFVLISRGRANEAAEALSRAYALNKSDLRLALVDGLISVKRGDGTAAQKALDTLNRIPDLSVADRRERDALTEEIQRLYRKGG